MTTSDSETSGTMDPFPSAQFKFSLRQVVRITESGEVGTVHARSDSTMGEGQYMVRYRDADGRATEQWWSENALESF
jgi:hypothetical protein